MLEDAAVLAKALQILAKREYAVAELRLKLLQKFDQIELVDQAVNYCIANNYVSDTRYAEHFVWVKAKYGWGPLYLRAKLDAWQIDGVIIDKALAQKTEIDWIFVGLTWVKKHDVIDNVYGFSNKQIQKLMRRGFEFDMIKKIQAAWLAELQLLKESNDGN